MFFLPFFDEVCQERVFFMVILRLKVMKLQTHTLQRCTKRTFMLMTFRKIRRKIIVIGSNYTEMSFHEAVNGHIIPCFIPSYHVSPLCRRGRIRTRNLSTPVHYRIYSCIHNHQALTITDV